MPAPPTPRTTRNSLGLRTRDAGHTPARRTRAARRRRARTPTPSPSPSPPPPPATSPLSVTPTRPAPSLPLSLSPAPATALSSPPSAPPSLSSSPHPAPLSLVSSLQGRHAYGLVWNTLRPRLPLLPPVPNALDQNRSEIVRRTRRHIPGTRDLPRLLPSPELESRLFNSIGEQEGEGFGRGLYTAIRNDRFMRRCTCKLPPIYDNKEAAEAPSARGHFRFFVFGERQDQLGVILCATDRRDSCRCEREVAPVYFGVLNVPALNKNGKRPAEDSELDLLAESTVQGHSTEVVRVVPAPAPAPVNPARTNETRRRRMAAYLQLKLNHIRAMGNSVVLAVFGRLGRHAAATNTEAVDTRRIDPGSNSFTVKRFKRQVCVPAKGPEVDLQQLPYLSWAKDVTEYIGADNIHRLQGEFHRQINLINAGFLCGGVSIEAIRANAKAHEDVDLSITIHKLMCERVGTFTAYDSADVQADYFSRAKAIYLRGLMGITSFIHYAYDHETFSQVQREVPVPTTPLWFGSYDFRTDTRQGAELLAWLIPGADSEIKDAVSKMCVDANAIHKQELPPSFVFHPGTDEHPLMPGSFPISVYDEIPMDHITIDPVHALKHPSSEPDPPAKGTDFKVVAQPKGILKKPKEWPQAPASPAYVPTNDKRRKLTFGSPAATYLPPKHIPNKVCSVNDAIVGEYLAAELHGNRSVEAADSYLSIVNHTRLGLISPSNYTAVRSGPCSEEDAQDHEQRMKLRYHATKYGGLLRDFSKVDLKDEANEPAREPEVGIPFFGNLAFAEEGFDEAETVETAVIDEQDDRVSHHLVKGYEDMMEQDIHPEVPVMEAVLEKERLHKMAIQESRGTPEGRHRYMNQWFADDTIPAISMLEDELEMSSAKRDQFECNHQVRREIEEYHARQVREKKLREQEVERRRQEEKRLRQEEEERLRKEEERRRIEEERRQQEEQRRAEEERQQREEEDRRRAAEAKHDNEAAKYAATTGLRAPSRPIISPLSQEWVDKLSKASRANPQAELTKTLDGNPLRRPDFADRLLPEKAWLNDNIIIGSILYIADYVNNAAGVNGKLNPKCSALSSFFWTRLQTAGLNSCARIMRLAGIRKENFLEIDTILIPICQDNHWTLGVVCPSRRTVSHVDSIKSGASSPGIANTLMAWVKATLGDGYVENEWKKITYHAPRQTNGYDCGVFAITNAICFALGIDPVEAYSANQLTLQRNRLAAILLNGGFKGDFTLDGL